GRPGVAGERGDSGDLRAGGDRWRPLRGRRRGRRHADYASATAWRGQDLRPADRPQRAAREATPGRARDGGGCTQPAHPCAPQTGDRGVPGQGNRAAASRADIGHAVRLLASRCADQGWVRKRKLGAGPSRTGGHSHGQGDRAPEGPYVSRSVVRLTSAFTIVSVGPGERSPYLALNASDTLRCVSSSLTGSAPTSIVRPSSSSAALPSARARRYQAPLSPR